MFRYSIRPHLLSPELKKPREEAESAILSLKKSSHVADFFEIPEGQLLHILYNIPSASKYRIFDIPKKTGGVRQIKAPVGGTAILQKKLRPILYSLYRTKRCVHGFVPKRSIVTNAMQHSKKKFVLNIDLEDFFGSINFGRVRGLFMGKPFNMGAEAATVMAQLCVHENGLPQGASTSPIISNFIASDLDKRLTKIAKRFGLHYTRYADDITFSTTKKEFPRSIAHCEDGNPITSKTTLGKILLDEISESGFRVNYKKVRLQVKGFRQDATGLTINEFPNVRRKFIRNIRAMLHAWKRYGLVLAETEYLAKYAKKEVEIEKKDGSYFKNVIYGRLAFLKMVRGSDDALYMKLCVVVADLDPNAPDSFKELRKMYEKFDVFISHASEDKENVVMPIYEACEKAGINAFIDVKYITWGDSLTEKINHALGRSKFVLAVLSKNSVDKAWPAKEINSALAREIEGKQKILPLIVGNENLDSIPLLQDKLHIEWDGNADLIAERIKAMLY